MSKAKLGQSSLEGLGEPDYDFLDKSSDPTEKDGDLKKTKNDEHERYILGTLVVRVVAARDLVPIEKGNLLQSATRRYRGRGGSSNPYASVRFRGQSQRTTVVYDTTDPIWPRNETMFLDVSLPLPKLTHHTTQHDEQRQEPTLTVAIFHANPELQPKKLSASAKSLKEATFGDSNDPFLGMAMIDVAPLLTGKIPTLDEWIYLSGAQSERCGSVRIVCEYEPSDASPRPGDWVKFTAFCTKPDLYPVDPTRTYRVQQVKDDEVILSVTTSEGWLSTFMVHRFMLITEHRDRDAFERYHEEFVSITERLAHSPMLNAVKDQVQKVPDEGLVFVGLDAIQSGASLLDRWIKGGVNTAVEDFTYATNWDGRSAGVPSAERSAPMQDAHSDNAHSFSPATAELDDKDMTKAIPGMPNCPITGEAMVDPVVAGDGHTYERRAIAMWLQMSDKSPLTGELLAHKSLVSNYMLLSSLEKQASQSINDPTAPAARENEGDGVGVLEEEPTLDKVGIGRDRIDTEADGSVDALSASDVEHAKPEDPGPCK